MPKVSVIIPCYNQGMYLEEAIQSVLAQSFRHFEIIIVDDGSTDEATRALLENYSRPHCTVYRKQNEGLPVARNFGILRSKGEYILPLDADDKIGNGYLEEAAAVLDRYPDVKIVYCQARYFGARKGVVKTPPFKLDEMLIHNLVFATAFFRRNDFNKTRGYVAEMKTGWEDWDFWLSLLEEGGRVYQIPKTYFFYRARKHSMVESLSAAQKRELRRRVFLNHQNLYQRHFDSLTHQYYELMDSPDLKIGRMLLNPLRALSGKILNSSSRRSPLWWEWPKP